MDGNDGIPKYRNRPENPFHSTMRPVSASTLLLLTLAIPTACTPWQEDGASKLSSDTILRHVEVLSSDEFAGRAPATPGEDLTVDYIIAQLEAIGVEPGMPDGSFTQEIPLLAMNVDRSSASIRQRSTANRRGTTLSYYDDFVAWPSNEQENVRLRNVELLYVGYGIEAPEYDWDDYKGVDVRGKVLVFKNNDPEIHPELFDGATRLYYGRWSYKHEKAFEKGALGAIIIHTTPSAGYPWLVVANSWGRQRFTLKSAPGAMDAAPAFNGWLTTTASQALFSAAGLDLSEQLAAAESPDFTPVPLRGVTLDVDLDATYGDLSTRNIVAAIPGNDPALADEYLVVTAHHDHLGVTFPVQGDSINNGAHDNAAGVASLLNLAEAFQAVQPHLRRSVLLLVVGAEEMGLLGSKYWAENPTVDPAYVTANLNLDATQIYGPTRDLVVVGHGRNTFSDIMESVASGKGRTMIPDANPDQGMFYRSDHFSLAKVGIPALFPGEGSDFTDKPEGYAAVIDSVHATNYHNVNDEVNAYWDLRGAIENLHIFFESSLQVINADRMMEWKPGDEFEAARKASLERRSANP
jgi:Zn-dependent M28 family amino/carboxypeptidase